MMKRKRSKRSLVLQHHKGHWIKLFRGTVPVFVAVTLNRVVGQALDLMVGSSNLAVILAVHFLYALIIAHALGYVVVLYLPKEHPLFNYMYSLAADNSSFAWNNTITVVILKWLYDTENVHIALIAWAVMVVLVVLVICLVSYLQEASIAMSAEQRASIRDFESDSFALAIAYSLTIIFASSLFFPHDSDDDALTDDAISPDLYSWYFLIYLLVMTMLIASYQAYLHYQHVLRRRRHHRDNHRDAAYDHLLPSEHDLRLLPDDEEDDDEEEEEEEVEVALSTLEMTYGEPTDMDQQAAPKGCCAWLFSWDPSGQCVQSLYCLYYTCLGYLVACGWHVWAVLTFQSMFTFRGGDAIGTLIYALLATLFIASVMTCTTVKKELSALRRPLVHSAPTAAVEQEEHHGLMFTAFGSLLVGWSWQTFFSTLFAALIPGSQDGIILGAGVTTAAVVFYLGAKVELLLYQRKKRRDSRRSSSTAQQQAEEEEMRVGSPVHIHIDLTV